MEMIRVGSFQLEMKPHSIRNSCKSNVVHKNNYSVQAIVVK